MSCSYTETFSAATEIKLNQKHSQTLRDGVLLPEHGVCIVVVVRRLRRRSATFGKRSDLCMRALMLSYSVVVCTVQIVLKTARMGYFGRLFSISSPFSWLLLLCERNGLIFFLFCSVVTAHSAIGFDGGGGVGTKCTLWQNVQFSLRSIFGPIGVPDVVFVCMCQCGSEDNSIYVYVWDSFDSNMWLFCMWQCEYREHSTHSPKSSGIHFIYIHCSAYVIGVLLLPLFFFFCCCWCWWWRIFSPFSVSLALAMCILCVCAILQKR